MDKKWKIACMIVYLLICTLDFIVIPTYIMHMHTKVNSYDYFKEINEIFENDKDAMQIILSSNRKTGEWTPFSLRNGGILHAAFGAILTGSIIGRKKE